MSSIIISAETAALDAAQLQPRRSAVSCHAQGLGASNRTLVSREKDLYVLMVIAICIVVVILLNTQIHKL